MYIRHYFPIVFFYLLFLSNLSAQSRLQSAINTFVKDPSLQNASISISVIDIQNGQLVASYDPNRSLIPASSLKVMTTATALSLFGAAHTFKTELQYDGAIEQGVLNGNLYIKGYGDPTFGSDQMEGAGDLTTVMNEMLNATQQAGIQQLNGFVVGDASYFTSAVTPATWQWNDMGNYYGAGAFGLNIHENLYYLHFQQSSRLGAIPKVVRTVPSIPNLAFLNEVTSAGKGTGDNAYIYGAPYTYLRYLRGTIPVGSQIFKIKGSIPDPSFYAAYRLNEYLENSGISTPKLVITFLEQQREGTARTSGRRTIYTRRSPLLKDIVKRTNTKSVNLYCESMLKIIGAEHGRGGSAQEGVKVMKNFWKERGLDTKGLYLDDGSGLSPRNAVTSYQLAKMMQLATRESTYPAFYDSLPIAGQTGSLKRMFRGTVAAGKLRAKSGTLNRVRSYTGYATTSGGKKVSFSIIVNNFSGSGGAIRRKIEKVMLAICQ